MTAVSTDHLRAFAHAVGETLGLDVTEARFGELEGILNARLNACGLEPASYLAWLHAESETRELEALASLLTVSETFFFRHQQQLDAGVARLLHWARAGGPTPLRVLSLGCASGEEPYSLAMLLLERWPENPERFEIVAADLNPVALERARRGEFGQWSLRATSQATIARWFERQGKTFVLSPVVRDRVRFLPGNIANDDASVFTRGPYHAIFCRNVLMYFTREQYQRAVSRLARALAPGGCLFLGHAETLRGLDTDLELTSDGAAFYYLRAESSRDDRPSQQLAPSLALSDDDTPWMDTIARSTARVAALAAVDLPAEHAPTAQPPLALLQQERFDQALHALRSMPSSTAREPEMRLLEAVLLLHQSDLDGAETSSRELLLDPELAASGHYLLALCCEARTDLSTAAKHDQAAIAADPVFSLPRLHLGRVLRRLGSSGATDELVIARRLLEREDPARLALFGAGLGRASLLAFCDAELMQAQREVRS